jgi:very-short-patch-repair endonuclease
LTITFDRSRGRSGEENRDKPTAQERLIGLLDYIEQVEKVKRKPAFVVPTEFYCAYEDAVRGLPGVEFDLTAEGDELWLRVPRLKEEDPPQPSDKLKPWVVPAKNPDKQPALREEITVPSEKPGEPPQVLKRSAFPDIDRAFAAYLTGSWNPWAEYERPRRKTMAVYKRLFSIQQAMESEGADTPLELVWGVGIALWKHESGQNIGYPVLTQLVEITLDTRSLALEVRPRDLLPVLETDPFAALNVPGVRQLESAWRAYLEDAELTLSPFDPKSFEPVLKHSVAFLDSSGRYWPEIRKDNEDRLLPERTEHLTVTDTWVLYARKRSPNFLIEDLQRLKQNLESVEIVPGGPATLVSEPTEEVNVPTPVFFRGLSFGGGELPPGSRPNELYFPKAYNEEQVSIVQKLETSDGVVVQGPPGTGKTHTIANIICHYLANGKRVLVTSKGEPALAVLREQIPESVRALTVALLTDEKDGMRQFEHAIQTIAATVSRINPTELEREARALSHRIDEFHARLAAIDQEISRWAAHHMKRVRFQRREILPEELAHHVVERAKNYGWFPDKLTAKPAELKFSNSDILSVRKARLALGRDLEYLGVDLPAADSFPDGNGVLHLHEDLARAKQMAAKMEEDGLPPLADARPETLQRAQTLFGLVQDALTLMDKAYAAGHVYTAAIHQSYRSAKAEVLMGLDGLLQAVDGLEKERQGFMQRPVEVPGEAELDDEFVEAVERASNGKSPLGPFTFGKRELKARLQAVRVLGLKPESGSDWGHVLGWLDFRKRCRAVVARWNSTAGEFTLPPLEGSAPEALRVLAPHVEQITLLKRLVTDYEQRLPGLVREVFGEGIPGGAVTQDREPLSELAEILSCHLTRSRLAYAANAVSDLVSKLSGKAGAIVETMRVFLTKEMGDEGLTAAEAGERWSGFLAELRRLAARRGELAEVARVSQLVEQSGALKWSRALRSDPALDGADNWTPADWLEAWQWREAAAFLEAIDGRGRLVRLQADRLAAETDLAHAYGRLVEQKTWIEVYKQSPDSVKAALQAYLNAVMHIGRGTGIRAIRYRKEARTAMLQAYRAVPCWIMPQWRVSETLPPEIGKFDLVIVDEASQSDIWALPCLLRGEKLLVVGDDKQVSPDGIGFAEEKIKDLKNRFLKDQVHGDQMTPEKSLYDLAKVVFAGQNVMLREHFRCVAPIIEFSKREFYQNGIRPLRIPKPSEKLDPPLVDVFVKGGSRKGKLNEAEARAIVDEVKAILADKRCATRTIGVVSLLGIEQAHRIFELIKEEIPGEDIVGRRITVGDARTFQGKERDIMLMSMVATPDQKTSASGSTYEQRFNVAASRARDRMYLFRSVELPDLSKNDLKATLTEHFAAPFHEDPVKVASLRELCRSGFERELFDVLVSRGYRVRPQVKVGGYSMDLVVEGDEDRRLAIECDGDQYHGPERWSADMARQRVLERAGWTFWRCFSSTFTLRRQAVLKDLIATLKKMGIEPIGAAELDLGRYTEHRVVDPFAVTEVVEEMLAGERPDASSADASPSVAGSQVMAGPAEPKSVLADTNTEPAPSPGVTAEPSVTGTGGRGD